MNRVQSRWIVRGAVSEQPSAQQLAARGLACAGASSNEVPVEIALFVEIVRTQPGVGIKDLAVLCAQ